MKKNLNFLITVFGIIYIAFQMLHVFSASGSVDSTSTISKAYINALGEEVALTDYQGDYLWVDYAAEWCSYCEPQTRTLKRLEAKYGDKLGFLTVVTGTGKVMEPPSAETAMKWARRFDLDTNKVLAYFSTNRLPYHILYSPSGAVLYQGSGLFNASKIKDILNTHTSLFD